MSYECAASKPLRAAAPNGSPRMCVMLLLLILHPLSTNASISQLVSTSAKPVDPMRANIPVTPANAKPEDVFKGNMRNSFRNQQSLVFDPEPTGCPRRCHRISTANEVVLRDRLLRSGGAAVFPIEDVPRNAAGEFVIAGWFRIRNKRSLIAKGITHVAFKDIFGFHTC